MAEPRSHFHDDIADLEQTMLNVGEMAERMVTLAVSALIDRNEEAIDEVISMDAEVDRIYAEAHNRWMQLMARQQPVASDLRVMSVLLHLNVTLERMGDQTVNMVKLARATRGLPHAEKIVEQIREMGDLVRPMIRTSLQAFARRDLDEALLLPAMDEPVDRLNRNMYREVVACGPDQQLLEWATRMMMVSRALERIGDQAVDIAEQVAFLVTGEMHEFSEEGFGVR